MPYLQILLTVRRKMVLDNWESGINRDLPGYIGTPFY